MTIVVSVVLVAAAIAGLAMVVTGFVVHRPS